VGEPRRTPETVGQNEPAPHAALTQTQVSATPAATESWRERVMSAARSAVERVGAYGQAAVNALVLDDWKALTTAQSTPMQRLEGGADLASWAIPEGKVVEIAGHAVLKASEMAAAHLTASGLEHSGAVAAAIAISRGLSRPVTEAERTGHFQSASDFRKFMGLPPSTADPNAIGTILSRRTTRTERISFPSSKSTASKMSCPFLVTFIREPADFPRSLKRQTLV
jgi:hypothetical protein